jgi:Zn-dependent protease
MEKESDISEFLREASSLISFSTEDLEADSAVMVLKNPSETDIALFRDLLSRANRYGFTIFTGREGSSRIYVARKMERDKTGSFSFRVKIILAAAAVISTFYVGYEYELAYSQSSGLLYLLSYAAVFFVSPIMVIILARETGRYIAMKADGLHYSFPIILPDPIGVGVIGSVISQKQPFVSRKSMLKSGVYPLVFGFGLSTFFLLVGLFVLPGINSYAPTVSTPITKLSLPLFFSLVLSRIIPQSVALNLLSYAGWVGIVMNSFNALPLGYLDGGLIFSSISPNYSRVLSYASIIALVGLSFVYASWFILVIFALLIGLQGPSALYSLRGLSKKNKAIILLVLFFIIGGIVPIPSHISPSNFSMASYQNSYVIVNGTHTNISVSVRITDISGALLAPAFSVSPSTGFTISSNSSSISSGESAIFRILLDTASLRTTGYYHYNITAYSGSAIQSSEITVLSVNESRQLSFNNSNPLILKGKYKDPVNISFLYSSIGEKNITLFSFAPDNFSYTVSLENLTLRYTGSSEILSSPFTVKLGNPMLLSFMANTPVRSWEIVAMTSSYNAAIAVITIT